MRNELPLQGKLLALDIGRRHTGVAISDDKQTAVFAREEWNHSTQEELIDCVRAFLEKEELVGFLVGWPLDMSGQETEETHLVEEVISKMRVFGLPIVLMDERWTTKQAAKDHGSHSEAALILLNTHLDSK